MRRMLVFLVLISIISCHKHLETQRITSTKIDASAMVKKDIAAQDSIFENEIICDSVYQKQKL
ncbi:conserved hypothetical protein [Chryseobacterium sp. 8AT]|nr:conserved hypothetical protein [Chryseobacterium sp. 8AT]